MQSRTSWFNLALVRKNLLRGWPLWTAFTLLWISILPMQIFSRSFIYTGDSHLDLARDILEIASEAGPIITMLYGLLVAMVMFSFLYKSRSVNTFGALPVRRETLFGSAVLSGLLVFLIPMLLTIIMTYFATLATNLPEPLACLQVLAFNGLIYLFAFGFATLCALLVGNTLSLMGLYVILNFTVVALGYTILVLLDRFLFGFQIESNILDTFAPYSPLAQLSMYNLDVQWQNGYLTAVAIDTCGYVAIIALVGLVCFAIAFLLLRRRHMERAGDVIAVKQLRPVFKYVFTLGCTIVLGSTFCSMWSLYGFAPVLLCCLLGGFFGYFLAEILLKKSFNVWKKEWLGFGISAVVIVGLLTFTYLDGWGYQGRVPTTDTVATVQIGQSIYGIDSAKALDDPAFITDVIAFHQSVLHEKYQTNRDAPETTFSVCYTLFDGSTFKRTYTIPFDPTNWDGDGLYGQYCALFNDPYYLESTLLDGVEVTGPESFAWAEVNWGASYENAGSVILSQEEGYDLYQNAFLPDLRDGNIGFELERKGLDSDREKGYTRIAFTLFNATPTDEDVEVHGKYPVTADKTNPYMNGTRELEFTVSPYATRTLKAIEKLGATYYPCVPFPQ